MTSKGSYDVLVAGGGFAGALTAFLLGRESLSVLLVEKQQAHSRESVGEHLPPIAVGLLNRLSEKFENIELAKGVKCPGICSRWGTDQELTQDYIYSPYAQYGLNIDRSQCCSMFLQAFETVRGTRLKQAEVRACDRDSSGWNVSLNTEFGHQDTRCQFLVDATGQASGLVNRFRLSRRIVDDRQIAIYQSADCASNDQAVLLESDRNGWWYSAPVLGNRTINILFTCKATLGSAGLTKEEFYLEEARRVKSPLAKRLNHRRGDLNARMVLSSRLECASGAGWIAVGDAASCYDPLASLGIYKALKSAILASSAVLSFFEGEGEELTQYDQQVTNEYREYFQQRQHYYERAARFHKSEFWNGRLPRNSRMNSQAIFRSAQTNTPTGEKVHGS